VSSQTIGLALVLFGALLIYAGWTNRPLARLLLGDTGATKPAAARGTHG
jgi:UDP-N-acetylmuramyl pentapeptide phosphotransferase/UDP-N-acetylglucosamine-1-phosphate transferase